jgi:phenylacetate-CoA ligase
VPSPYGPSPKSVVIHQTNPRAEGVALLRRHLEETQWSPEVEILERQLALADELISYCNKQSLWLQDRLAADQASSRTISDFAAFQRLPITTKDDLQRAGDRLFCRTSPRAHGYSTRYMTSGSTGQPTVVRRTCLNETDLFAMTLRDHDWHRRDYGLPDCAVRSRATQPILMPDWASPVKLLFDSVPSLILPLAWDLRRLNKAIQDFRPGYLQLFPSVLRGLLGYLRDTGEAISSLRQIRTYGEVLTEDERKAASKLLGTPVVDNYCSQEVGIIACQCPETSVLHVSSEFLLVEVIREDGYHCEPGEVGRVLVTDLHNFATPIIRYDLGDYAEVAPPCHCGRKGLTLSRVLGRRRNLMLLPDGNYCWPRLGHLFREYEKIVPVKQFRVFQHGPNEIEVWLVTAGASADADGSVLRRLIREITGYEFFLRVRVFDDVLPRSASAKTQDFVNLHHNHR